jgi:hypothetical protein
MKTKSWLFLSLVFGTPAALLAQERMYECHWKMHPIWW